MGNTSHFAALAVKEMAFLISRSKWCFMEASWCLRHTSKFKSKMSLLNLLYCFCRTHETLCYTYLTSPKQKFLLTHFLLYQEKRRKENILMPETERDKETRVTSPSINNKNKQQWNKKNTRRQMLLARPSIRKLMIILMKTNSPLKVHGGKQRGVNFKY
jgi:hypothetical protein